MFIKIDKKFIKEVRKDIKDNPNRETGYVYKPDNTYKKMKGTKHEVKFPDGDIVGIEMHTHPLKSSYGNNSFPPSYVDYTNSYIHYKINDAVVFDNCGIWIYRPNKNLVNTPNNILKTDFYKNSIVKGILHYNGKYISDKDYTIDKYIKDIKKLGFTTNNENRKFELGFNVKYYSYAEFNKLGSLKLRFFTQSKIDEFKKSI